MTTRFRLAFVIALLAGAPSAYATCGWFGTQLECSLGSSDVVFGAQVADDPAYATSVRPSPFHNQGDLLDGPAASPAPFRLELQNVGVDPTLCRRFGDESYCY
jgi:hypothetical protein